jgi:uncharacterized membrane protein
MPDLHPALRLARDHYPAFGELRLHGNDWVGVLIAVLVVSLFVHMAARIVLDRGGFIQALATTVIGFLLAGLVMTLVPGVLGLTLAFVVWALVAAAFYRTRWVKGAVVGLVAWVLGLLIMWLVGILLANL